MASAAPDPQAAPASSTEPPAAWQLSIPETLNEREPGSSTVFVVYEIHTQPPSARISVVRHRYNDLVQLEARLLATFGSLLDHAHSVFPKKSLFSLSTNVEERRAKLEAYLQLLLTIPQVRDCYPLRDFLNVRDGCILYHTLTLCPTCAVVERRAWPWTPAHIAFNSHSGAWLHSHCATHGPAAVQLCSKADLFWHWVAPEAMEDHLPAIERWGACAADPALARRRLLARAGSSGAAALNASTNSLSASSSLFGSLWSSTAATPDTPTRIYPAVYDIYLAAAASASASASASISAPASAASGSSSAAPATSASLDSGVALISEGELSTRLDHVNPLEATDQAPTAHFRTLLRFRTPASSDIAGLNRLLQHGLFLTRGRRVVVEGTPERIAALTRLPDSAMLSPRVYPQLHLLVHRGRELPARMELVAALGELASLEDIAVATELCVERPWPDLGPLFDSLLRHQKMVRLIVVTLQRSPQQIMRAAATKRASTQGKSTTVAMDGSRISLSRASDVQNTVDLVPVINMISQAVDQTLEEKDFFSLSALALLEPVLMLLGYGRYAADASCTLGCAAVLIHTEEGETLSLNSLIDMDLFHSQMRPLLASVRASNYSVTSALAAATKARKALRSCLREGVEARFPRLAQLPLEKSTVTALGNAMGRAQIIVARRDMDMASVDIEALLHTCEDTSFVQHIAAGLR